MLGLERELHMKPSLLRLRSLGYICLFCLGSEGAARADMGVPMIFVTMPLMVIALIPIILIESFYPCAQNSRKRQISLMGDIGG